MYVQDVCIICVSVGAHTAAMAGHWVSSIAFQLNALKQSFTEPTQLFDRGTGYSESSPQGS